MERIVLTEFIEAGVYFAVIFLVLNVCREHSNELQFCSFKQQVIEGLSAMMGYVDPFLGQPLELELWACILL